MFIFVRYFLAESVSQLNNLTWAGQVCFYPSSASSIQLRVFKTFGTTFASDGRLMGSEDVQSVNCDQGANTCAIKVPAPGVALVFLTDQALSESEGTHTATFATTAVTKLSNTATIDPAVLATSNGHSGSSWRLGSTSRGSSGAAGLRNALPGLPASIGVMLLGAAAVIGGVILW